METLGLWLRDIPVQQKLDYLGEGCWSVYSKKSLRVRLLPQGGTQNPVDVLFLGSLVPTLPWVVVNEPVSLTKETLLQQQLCNICHSAQKTNKGSMWLKKAVWLPLSPAPLLGDREENRRLGAESPGAGTESLKNAPFGEYSDQSQVNLFLFILHFWLLRWC